MPRRTWISALGGRHPAGIALGGVAVLLLAAGAPPSGTCAVYTSTLDFSVGNRFNLEHYTNPGTGDQCLRLADQADVRPWPYVGIAVSGTDGGVQVRRGSIVRIAVDDLAYGVKAGDVIGEYYTSPIDRPNNPSRTTVDGYGNIWVGNRDEAGGGQGSVTRIGLAIGGTRVDAAGVPDANGDYLKGPFDYCTCEDRDGDGLIHTSRGYAHGNGVTDWKDRRLPWPAGTLAQAEDECITAFVRTAGTNVRHIAIDGNNDIWVGGWGNKDFELLDNTTAVAVPGSLLQASCGGYGGLVDPCGVLWSANWAASPQSNTILRFDPASGGAACLSGSAVNGWAPDAYGLAFDPETCHIWATTATIDNTVREISPAGAQLASYAHTTSASNLVARGVVVSDGSVWVAHSQGNPQGTLHSSTVGHVRTDGTLVGAVSLDPNPTGVPGRNPHGVALDSNGRIWAANRITHNVMRIDPNLGPVGGGGFKVGAVDLAVDLGANAWPYNYSDMSGALHMLASPQGHWTFIHDGGSPGTPWALLDWTALLTGGSSVQVRVRASDSVVPNGPWTAVQDNVPFTGVTGRYLQVQVTLKRGKQIVGDCCVPNGEAVLCDLKICKDSDCTATIEKIICATDGSGDVTAKLSVTNHTQVDVHKILITPLPAGTPVTAAPNIISQFIPVGGTATVSTIFSGLASDQPFCFIATLLDGSMQECCSTEVCFTPDCSCLQVREDTTFVQCDPSGTPGAFTLKFRIDNLSPFAIQHIFFFEPPGVTIQPNYVALPTPVQPLGTTPEITLHVTGGFPNTTLCFTASVHTPTLAECCAREICFTMPDCDTVVFLGACCFSFPELPGQPFCTTTTQFGCSQLPNSVFLGPLVSCASSPCLDGIATNSALLPVASCCWPVHTEVVQRLVICNPGLVARNYSWSVVSAAGAGCNHVIAPQSISPNSGSVLVAAGGCTTIDISIPCEAALADGGSGTACLYATVTDGTAAGTSTSSGLVRAIVYPPVLSPRWCVSGPVDQGPVSVLFGASVQGSFELANVGEVDGALSFSIVGGGNLSIGGLPPGEATEVYQGVGAGESVSIAFDASFAEHAPGAIFHALFSADIDGDGVSEPLAAIPFISVIMPPCPADLDGDGQVDGNDLGALLAAWGSDSPLADLDQNGTVDGADLGVLIASWGECP